MIHAVQPMKEFAIQSMTPKMKRANATVKRMSTADDAIHARMDIGIWMPTTLWAVKNVRATCWAPLEIWAVTCSPVNVCASVW